MCMSILVAAGISCVSLASLMPIEGIEFPENTGNDLERLQEQLHLTAEPYLQHKDRFVPVFCL